MKLLNTILYAFSLATTVAGVPVGSPFTAGLIIEPLPSDSEDAPAQIEDAPTLPGFGNMAYPSNSTIVNKYALPDSPEGIELDGGTCKYVKLGGQGKVGETSLEARCVDEAGTWWDTSLNMNDCAANEGGFLVFREGGNFDESCRPCVVTDPGDILGLQLKCKCKKDNQEFQYGLLPLGSHINHPLAIRPVHGRLTCGNKQGLQTPSFFEY